MNLCLRISVEGGGCSGFKYVYSIEDFSKVNNDDKVFERDGSKVIIDSNSFDLLKGSTVDYVQEMIRSAFTIVNNPQSESGKSSSYFTAFKSLNSIFAACGCGSSFAAKNFAINPAVD